MILRTYEDLWPFAGAWSATSTLTSLDRQHFATKELPLFFNGLAAYHRSGAKALSAMGSVGFESVVVPPLGDGGDVFYDDNTWLALALVRHYELLLDERAISLAQRLYEFVISGWSSEASWSHPGGVRWKVPLSCVSRNACSNGPVAELAARIHELTGDQSALEWSIRIYDWVRSSLLGADGLYFDRITPDGTVSKDIWSYNQGSMIGAGVLLYGITGEQEYLSQAKSTAAASITHFTSSALQEERPAAFSAVFFRNLFLLDHIAPDPAYRELATAYGNVMWEQCRDSRTGLFQDGESSLNESAPLVEIYALLAGAPPHA
ncbi:MAG TPA: glycoside hydrolase family 76 protein [Acidimicrobiales bacterium]|nr:glycoside hydrolase family 76 protein [Acidimicrobiales bacterium]